MTKHLFGLLLIVISSYADQQVITTKKFPENFLLGVATSAVQVEGGWNQDGKGENIWDHAIHTNASFVTNNDTADIACDSYNKWEQDIQMLKHLNVTHYRLSLSWTRILPTGFTYKINQKGIDYYNNIINALLENGIKPMVTLFHWDTPQPIEEGGGWLNPGTIDAFAEYAELCFQMFGDRVKYWITFNEPKQTCNAGYSGDFVSLPPFIRSPGEDEYVCSRSVVLSHAKAWHIYEKKYRATQKGQIAITLDSTFVQPEDPKNATHVEAAENAMVFQLGLYLDPLFTGDYAPTMREIVDTKSKKQGYKVSRLPYFSEEEKRALKGALDYVGINCYTGQVAKPEVNPEGKGLKGDPEVNLYMPDDWESGDSPFIKITPWVCRDLVRWVHKRYAPKAIFITENGYPSAKNQVDDDFRISFHQRYLSNLREVLDEGINLIGYTAWSLMDNFEWMLGYSQKFGFYDVDFTSPNRTRTPKKSAEWYRKFTSSKCLVDQCN